VREKAKTFEDVERIAGIQRTTPVRPTLRDVDRLTAMRLRRWPAWKRKLRDIR